MFFHGARIQRNGQGRCTRFPTHSLSQASAQLLSTMDSLASTDRHLTLLTLSVHIRINHPGTVIPLRENAGMSGGGTRGLARHDRE